MYFSLDRFEETKAILQGDDGEVIVVEKDELPVDAKAGDVFQKIANRYQYNQAETETRKTRISRLQQLLRSRNGNTENRR